MLKFAPVFFVLVGCGVRGDPEPPERPTYIGRGRPLYRRATRNLDPAGPEDKPLPKIDVKSNSAPSG